MENRAGSLVTRLQLPFCLVEHGIEQASEGWLRFFKEYPGLDGVVGEARQFLRQGVAGQERRLLLVAEEDRCFALIAAAAGDACGLMYIRDETDLYRLARELAEQNAAAAAQEDTSPEQASTGAAFAHLAGRSDALWQAAHRARTALAQQLPVAIFGPPGVGKSRLATEAARTTGRRFHLVPVALYTDALLATLLLGEGKTPGLLGTKCVLILDGIQAMTLSGQQLLAEALAEGRFGPPRSPHAVRAAVIATICGDPWQLVERGKLDERLWSLFIGASLFLPPLRERQEDIVALSHAFVPSDKRIDPEALRALLAYRWPGNVRELEAVLRIASRTEGNQITADLLPPWIAHAVEVPAASEVAVSSNETDVLTLPEEIARLEEKRIREAILRFDGNVSHAARALGLKRQALQYKLKKYKLEV
ncbi:MAG: sigma 54-interacting transcriptional regulator [Firmicutes bacterium]|nr:sigma 54-interacting transcriptional regulator [Bacillota bacterium]